MQTEVTKVMTKKTRTVRVPYQTASGKKELVIGDGNVAIMAGPCSIESREHLVETAKAVQASGATFLRGGIFKMRTSVDSWQGLGVSAFGFISEVKRELGMPLVSEITDPRQISDFIDTVDMFQVGSRNMYNYELLRELGATGKPVLLKRAFAATVDEWIKAANYVLKAGHDNVVLCERGIRTFEPTTRNTLDLNSVAYIKAHTELPIIVDPSHGTGRPELIGPMSLAGVACGADGLIIEVHPRPREALSDADQAIDFNHFENIVRDVRKVSEALGRKLVTV